MIRWASDRMLLVGVSGIVRSSRSDNMNTSASARAQKTTWYCHHTRTSVSRGYLSASHTGVQLQRVARPQEAVPPAHCGHSQANRQGFVHREADEQSLLDEASAPRAGGAWGGVGEKRGERRIVGIGRASESLFSSASAQCFRDRVFGQREDAAGEGWAGFELGGRAYRNEPGGGHSARSVVRGLPQWGQQGRSTGSTPGSTFSDSAKRVS